MGPRLFDNFDLARPTLILEVAVKKNQASLTAAGIAFARVEWRTSGGGWFQGQRASGVPQLLVFLGRVVAIR